MKCPNFGSINIFKYFAYCEQAKHTVSTCFLTVILINLQFTELHYTVHTLSRLVASKLITEPDQHILGKKLLWLLFIVYFMIGMVITKCVREQPAQTGQKWVQCVQERKNTSAIEFFSRQNCFLTLQSSQNHVVKMQTTILE